MYPAENKRSRRLVRIKNKWTCHIHLENQISRYTITLHPLLCSCGIHRAKPKAAPSVLSLGSVAVIPRVVGGGFNFFYFPKFSNIIYRNFRTKNYLLFSASSVKIAPSDKVKSNRLFSIIPITGIITKNQEK